MNLIVAYSGRFSMQIIGNLFGEGSDWASALIGMILAIALLGVMFSVMFKVDWATRLEKYMTEKENRERRFKEAKQTRKVGLKTCES